MFFLLATLACVHHSSPSPATFTDPDSKNCTQTDLRVYLDLKSAPRFPVQLYIDVDPRSGRSVNSRGSSMLFDKPGRQELCFPGPIQQGGVVVNLGIFPSYRLGTRRYTMPALPLTDVYENSREPKVVNVRNFTTHERSEIGSPPQTVTTVISHSINIWVTVTPPAPY